MTVGWIDRRFGGGDRYHLSRPKDSYMRVPDEIRKTVLFIGVKNRLGAWDWSGTGYLIALSDYQLRWSETMEENGKQFATSTAHPFRLLATARHVAEKLEGVDFALKTMTVDGQPRIIEVPAGQQWFYHPTEKDDVDAAVTIFYPPDVRELALFTVQAEWFADEDAIREANLGVGDEVFIAGLFTMVRETILQHPIVRIGNLAMMPGERIPFGGKLIDAYLVESRSIGGLSGSPVFVRATVQVDAGLKFKPGFALNAVNSPTPNIEGIERLFLSGVGRIYFLGSMIGHWEAQTPTLSETVNMGVSLVVPAHKILEIIRQPELIEMADKIINEMQKSNVEAKAVFDFYDSKEKPFTQQDFESDLRKVTRRVETSESGEGTK
jgi:hypothetical protein